MFVFIFCALESAQDLYKSGLASQKDFEEAQSDYQKALARLELIFEAKKGTPESDELEILSMLVDNYENQNFPIGFPDPVEAIIFRLEQLGYNQSDLANIVGLKSRASEILNRKRKLSLEMIRQIHDRLNIPTEVLIQAY